MKRSAQAWAVSQGCGVKRGREGKLEIDRQVSPPRWRGKPVGGKISGEGENKKGGEEDVRQGAREFRGEGR